MLSLYHYEPSANSMKPLLCLAEKGLEYESYHVDLHNFEQYSAEFVAISPIGQVPVLIRDGAVIMVSIERMDGLLAERKWLAGEEYSLAHVISCSMVFRIPVLVPEPMSEEKTPKSMAWLDKMNARLAVRAALATTRQ